MLNIDQHWHNEEGFALELLALVAEQDGAAGVGEEQADAVLVEHIQQFYHAAQLHANLKALGQESIGFLYWHALRAAATIGIVRGFDNKRLTVAAHNGHIGGAIATELHSAQGHF